jgi:translocation and assembly module TamB
MARVSIEAALSGRLPPFGQSGMTEVDAEIREARIELSDSDPRKLQPLAAPADIVLVDRGTPTNREQARKLAALAALGPRVGAPSPEPERRSGFRLAINAPRKIWVTGRDARIELGVAPGFKVTVNEETHVSGEIVVQRGRVDVFGRRFDIKQDSTLHWDGPPERPELDVTAQHDNKNENVTVLISIKGPPENAKITISSTNRPDLNQAQLTQLLVSGHLQGSPSGGSSGFSARNEAASLATGLLASRLQKTLARRLPLDVLTIDSEGASLAGTQVEAGRYVTDKLYVGYIGRVGADPTRSQNRNAVHAEYQLTSRWELEGEYGDAGTGSADVMWKKNY